MAAKNSNKIQKKTLGRPKKYTKGIFDIICARVSDGESLRSVLRDTAMPETITFYRWLREDTTLCTQYDHAKQDRADTYADQLVEIADEAKLTTEQIQKAKLRIDTRKWIACKLHPRNYGDKTALEHSGPGGRAIQHEFSLSQEEIKRRADEMRGIDGGDDE